MIRIACNVLAISLATAPSAALSARAADLRDYALAACLTKQSASPELRTEGYRLADIVLARSGKSPLKWQALPAAVGTALAKRGMLMVDVDGPVTQATQPAPLATCLLAINDVSVAAVMRRLAAAARR